MSWIHQTEDKSCNFVAPAGLAADKEVLFPADEVLTPDYAATLAVAVRQMLTFLSPGALTGNVTINLTVNSQVTKGALLLIKLTADANGVRKAVLGTAISGADVYVQASKTVYLMLIFDGTNFVVTGKLQDDLETQFETSELQEPAYAATIAATITKRHTTIEVAQMTGALTLNLTIGANVKAGATLTVKLPSDGTGRTVTFGTGFVSPALAGVNSKTKIAAFIYNGTAFIPMGTPLQID